MKITAEDVKHYASLSKIKIDDTHAKKIAEEMTNIQNYISQLNEVDVTEIEPTAQVSGLENVSRKDELIDYNVSNEELLKNSIECNSQGIKVPKVL